MNAPQGLAAWKDRHAGATVVVCGCGESLKTLRAPQRVLTIGVNDVGRRFTPDYLVVVNPRSQFAPERWPHVAATQARAVFTQLPDLGLAHPQVVRFRLGRAGGTDFTDPDVLPHTRNSPYVAVGLAVQMGARRIGLLGVDLTEHHFFGPTGRHPLAHRLAQIDLEYGRLAAALRERGIELVNLSAPSRLASLPKADLETWLGDAPGNTSPAAPARGGLHIVSYATTPVAGVPALLARCISHATPHTARCVWARSGYGNGVDFTGDVEWTRHPGAARQLLEAADLVIVHNGHADPAHRRLLESKPVLTMAHNYGWNVDMGFVRAGGPGAVVGQYQVTLPEFAGWHVVPNPLPWWEPEHAAGDKDAALTIAYTPSGRHERYPPQHRLHWHGKGYTSTMAVLQRLAARHGVQLLTTAGGQVAHATALAFKRRAHIVIDECVTGSYHRNSLEGLAAGAVVVNGIGLLPGVEAALRQCAPRAGALPFVGSTLERLEEDLRALLGLGPQELLARGRASRAWLETHWDFAEQWSRCWQPAVDAALAGKPRARAAPSNPATLPIPATPRKPAMEHTRAAAVSVVIPHCGQERLPLLAAVLASLAQAPEVGEVIVAELGTAPVADRLAARWHARHLFVPHEGAFERARALNAGTAVARHPFVAWHDNDLLHEPGFLARAMAEMQQRRLDFLVPFGEVRYLSAEDSRSVRQGELPPAQARPANVIAARGRSPAWIGCLGLVRRQFITEHGGLVEGFRGWGGEDDAWFHKARLAGRCGGTQLPGQVLYHLYHPLSGGLVPGQPGAANPHYAANVERLRRVRQARSSAELRAAFPPEPPAAGRLQEPPATALPEAGLPVWTYWEGPCPAWVRACRRTMLRHVPNLRLLDPASFAALRRGDPDAAIDLSHLHVAHRADFIRAFLLQRFGGLWLDADCLVLQPLDEVLRLLQQHDYVAHRARQGVLSNAFIGARPGSRIAAAYYERVRRTVAAKHRFSWNWLGGDLLTEVVKADPSCLHELPCERVQPICWSRPQDFLAQRDPQEHAQHVVGDAWTYMLSNVELGKRFPSAGGDDLLHPRSFFRHLLQRALGPGDVQESLQREMLAAEHAEVFRRNRCESVSGTGSSLQQTAGLRQRLPLLLQHLDVRSLLDAPCGDRNWSRQLRLPAIDCHGAELLPELVAAQREANRDPRWTFHAADLLADPLPRVDAILCRDLTVHLSFAEIAAVLANFRRTGARWLLTTAFTGERENLDTSEGRWRTLNLQRPPFSFPPPLMLLNEGCSEDGGRYADKCLGVWRLDDLPLDLAHLSEGAATGAAGRAMTSGPTPSWPAASTTSVS